MPTLVTTVTHETHTTRHDRAHTVTTSKTVYTIDVTDLNARELFHGLGDRNHDGAPVTNLTVTLADNAAPFITACGRDDHQRTSYYCGMPKWAEHAIRATVPHVLTEAAA